MNGWSSPQTWVSIISALAALLAAWHAIKANSKSTTINANVNSRLEELVKILGQAEITIPHEVAAKVVYAPPQTVPQGATLEEELALQWLAKIKGMGRQQ